MSRYVKSFKDRKVEKTIVSLLNFSKAKKYQPFQRKPFSMQSCLDPNFVTVHIPEPFSSATKKVVTKYQTLVAKMIRMI